MLTFSVTLYPELLDGIIISGGGGSVYAGISRPSAIKSFPWSMAARRPLARDNGETMGAREGVLVYHAALVNQG